MVVMLDISNEAGDVLRTAFGPNLSRAALEAMAIEGYRSGRLSRYDVQQVLRFTNRWETEEWLGAHEVHQNYTVEDLEADRQTLESVLGSSCPRC